MFLTNALAWVIYFIINKTLESSSQLLEKTLYTVALLYQLDLARLF